MGADFLEQVVRQNTISIKVSEIDLLKRTRDVLNEHPHRFLMSGLPTGNTKPHNSHVVAVIDKILNIIDKLK